MWKFLHGGCPNEIGVSFRPLSRFGIRAVVPGLTRSARQAIQSIYDASFSVVGPRLWNCLPSNITTIEGEATFKVKLTEYLVGLLDEPPTAGYPRNHRNSLLDFSVAGQR